VSPAGQEKVIPQNGKQRLIGYLLRDVEMDAACGPNTLTVSLPASKATIASRLSLTPEYFSRVLHELEAQQRISIDRRNILIPEVQELLGCGAR
jgi:CRP-like cAMP-binding protein